MGDLAPADDAAGVADCFAGCKCDLSEADRMDRNDHDANLSTKIDRWPEDMTAISRSR